MNNVANQGPSRPIPALSGPGHQLPAEEPVGRIIWRQRRMIAKAAAATVAAAFAFLVVAPRGYTSTAELYVEQAGPRVIIESQSNPDRSDNYLNTQTQIIASNPIRAFSSLNAVGTDVASPGQFQLFGWGTSSDIAASSILRISKGRKEL